MINLDKALLDAVKENKNRRGESDWKLIKKLLDDKYGKRSIEGWRCLYKRVEARQQKAELTEINEKQLRTARNVIRDRLYRGATIGELKSATRLPELYILGIIKDLEDSDCLNIEKQGYDGFAKYRIVKNKYESPKTYEHYVGELKKKTFMVMSDTHLCSIYEQLSFVNYLYDEAKRRGIDTIYHCGDVVDGVYRSRPEQINGLHSYTFDQQADYVIENYPMRDGITTYFITGNHDETHIRNGGADIGKAIARSRPDMVYLGLGHAKVYLSPNCWISLLHPLDGSSYALSYSTQKYIDSLSGGEKPNMLFVGHHHKLLSMVNRNIYAYEVPSTCQQSMWEKRKRIQNTSGAWIISVEIDENGSLTKVIDEKIIQYNKIENDYLNYKKWK